jgi:hypothetical protein
MDLHSRIRLLSAPWLFLIIFVIASATAFTQTTNPVAPPIVTLIPRTTPLKDPGHGYAFNATPMDLAKAGYVEEEFFIEGTASRYTTPQGNATATVADSNHPYMTRIVVRRPTSKSKFNGTAIIEWTNVSQGHDHEVEWFEAKEHLVRSGYAWIGVSAQAVGVNALKEWSPKRYGSLDVTDSGKVMGDGLSYDIFTAAALAVRGKSKKEVMGGLKVERLIASGHSQSAGRLGTYFNQVHPLTPVFDGALIRGANPIMRTDLNVKIFKLLSESDVPLQATGYQADTDKLRTWAVAGTSHLDAKDSLGLGEVGLRAAGGPPVAGPEVLRGPTISGGGAGIGNFQTDATSPVCAVPTLFSRIPAHYVQDAVYDHLTRWIKEGKLPPPASQVETANGAIVRDKFGNAQGGIQLSQQAVATAMNTGRNTNPAPAPAPADGGGGRGARGGRGGGGGGFCNLLGGYTPFTSEQLGTLYPTHDAYVKMVKEITAKNLQAGYIVKADADATIADANKSNVGKK